MRRSRLIVDDRFPCLVAVVYQGDGESRRSANEKRNGTGFVYLLLLPFNLTSQPQSILPVPLRDLVHAKPILHRIQQSRHQPIDIVNIINFRSQRIRHIDGDDLPVCFALVENDYCAQNLDGLDLPRVGDFRADLAYVEGVVVATALGVGVCGGGVFPCLRSSIMDIQVYCSDIWGDRHT
jgi:hypothetical protein